MKLAPRRAALQRKRRTGQREVRVSCCSDCAAKHPEIVDVMGQAFWIADAEERSALIREMQTLKK